MTYPRNQDLWSDIVEVPPDFDFSSIELYYDPDKMDLVYWESYAGPEPPPIPYNPRFTTFTKEPLPAVRDLAYDLARDLVHVFGIDPSIFCEVDDGRSVLQVTTHRHPTALDCLRLESHVDGLTRQLSAKYPDLDFAISICRATFASRRPEPPELALHLEEFSPALRLLP